MQRSPLRRQPWRLADSVPLGLRINYKALCWTWQMPRSNVRMISGATVWRGNSPMLACSHVDAELQATTNHTEAILPQVSPNIQINNSFRHQTRAATNRRRRRIRDSSDEDGRPV